MDTKDTKEILHSSGLNLRVLCILFGDSALKRPNATAPENRMRSRLGRWLVAVVAVCLVPISVAAAAQTTIARRSLGEVALLDAAEQGDRAAALRLLARGADPNVSGPGGTTAIMWAAS